MKSLQEQLEQLKSTNSELQEEELRMKQQLAHLEKERTSLRVHGHEAKCQATAIHVNISRTTMEVGAQLSNSYCGIER